MAQEREMDGEIASNVLLHQDSGFIVSEFAVCGMIPQKVQHSLYRTCAIAGERLMGITICSPW